MINSGVSTVLELKAINNKLYIKRRSLKSEEKLVFEIKINESVISPEIILGVDQDNDVSEYDETNNKITLKKPSEVSPFLVIQVLLMIFMEQLKIVMSKMIWFVGRYLLEIKNPTYSYCFI